MDLTKYYFHDGVTEIEEFEDMEDLMIFQEKHREGTRIIQTVHIQPMSFGFRPRFWVPFGLFGYVYVKPIKYILQYRWLYLQDEDE